MKTVAILTGGVSSERQVAKWSAQFVEETLGTRAHVRMFFLPEELEAFVKLRATFDVAIPVLHGVGGEDGTIQGFLKTLGVPFLFSGVAAHAIGLNKAFAKTVMVQVGVCTPESAVVHQDDTYAYHSPVVVKPLHGGSTIGTTIVREEGQFATALQNAFRFDEEVLIEQFVEGREFTVGVIEENGNAVALPVIEIKANGHFDFDAKYTEGKMAQEICPAPIDDELRDRLQVEAVLAHQTIGARHATRSDFIVDAQNQEWFLEINTIPGMTKNSLLPKAIQESGRDFGALILEWVEDVS